jgi:hypothetical protein
MHLSIRDGRASADQRGGGESGDDEVAHFEVSLDLMGC